MISKCNSCDAEIRWVKMAGTGKRIPVNASPGDRGSLFVDWLARVATPAPVTTDPTNEPGRWFPHFDTCLARRKRSAPAQKVFNPTPPTETESRELRRLIGDEESLMLMIGEAITDDVEAWEPVPLSGPTPERSMRVTRDGLEFVLTIAMVKP